MQHLVAPDCHPSNYAPGPALFNFSDRADTDELTPYSVLMRAVLWFLQHRFNPLHLVCCLCGETRKCKCKANRHIYAFSSFTKRRDISVHVSTNDKNMLVNWCHLTYIWHYNSTVYNSGLFCDIIFLIKWYNLFPFSFRSSKTTERYFMVSK